MNLATQIIDQRVRGIVEEHSDILTEELGMGNDERRKRSAALLFLVAKTLFDFTDDEAFDGIVDGAHDFGVDAIYFDPPEDGELPIVLMQGKYRNRLDGRSGFPETGIAALIDAIGTLFDPAKNVSLNDRLEQRVEDIRSFVRAGAIPHVTVIAANNGRRWSSEADDRIDRARADFGSQVEWRHIGSEEILRQLQTPKEISADLQLVGDAIVETFDYRRVLVGRMSVSELARLTELHGNRLFERNIRRYLGLAGNRVNEAVAATLRDEAQRGNFYFFNNGITITCSKFRHNALKRGDWRVRLGDFQIVNGGQTARTVQRTARDTGLDVGAAEVLVRIYELESEDQELVESITFATNSQNPVDLRDLKSNDARQKALGESIAGLGYRYRTKREDRSVSSKDFTSAVVAEAVLAVWRERPHQARFLRREHFGALYNTIFTEDLNGAQAVAAALLLRHAENRRKRPSPDAPDFLAYGSRFVAMLMGGFLLADMGLSVEELQRLNHQTYDQAKELIAARAEDYAARAESDIETALEPLFKDRERTLQRLSAAFRRADLVEALTGESSAHA
ncbi:AIPR family protein [Candidatus Palauibacter sp.]|uniref:AIPR family protein n=1 Tax=Candidatus Palauibacter sp. TaxID=3101350 RepID=UPI003AF2AB4B